MLRAQSVQSAASSDMGDMGANGRAPGSSADDLQARLCYIVQLQFKNCS